jgi:hypothetical protein
MKKSITIAQITAILTVVLLAASCLGLSIHHGVRNPGAYFDRALGEIRDTEREDPARVGPVREVCVLLYDGDSGDLLEVNVPLGIANACLDLGATAAEHERDWNLVSGRGLDLRGVKDLRRFGPGLLAQINGEDGRLLVWLR